MEKWICCRELLPLPGLKVTALTDGMVNLVAERRESPTAAWVGDTFKEVEDRVTHWRPLPGEGLEWIVQMLGVVI